MKTVFLRVLEAEDKATALHDALREEPERARGRHRFEVDPTSFASVPRSPFAYWVSDRVRRLFKDLPPFEAEGRTARCGMATGYDFRWLRLSWECPFSSLVRLWMPFAKGGIFSPFYANIHLRVAWENSGSHLKSWKLEQLRLGKITANNSRCWNEAHYFRPGLTWPLRTHRFCPQVLPAGVVISVRGSGIYSEDPELFLGLFSSRLVDRLMRMLSGKDAHPQFDMGDVAALPIPYLATADRDHIASLARRAWSLRRLLDTHVETSHAFALPALLQMHGETLDKRAAAWSIAMCSSNSELAVIQTKIDELSFQVYGIDEDDRRAITEGLGTRVSEDASSVGPNDTEDDGGEDTDENESTADATGLAAELVSWSAGVAFGRFDIQLATGVRPMPTEPEPFDPLPACSPGMLTGGDGLPLAQQPAEYPVDFPEDGVLVDDLGHAQDLPTAVRAVFDAVFGAGADRWWYDVAEMLDPKGHDLRAWLSGKFFEHHLKHHSKSGRKAPIVWQLGTPSGRYSVWLYAHRLTRDTFFQLQNEVVGPKLTHEERRLASLMQNAGGSPSVAERKEIAAHEAIVEELRAMLDEIKRVAPLWNANLDDGVVLTMAPLWRLVPQHKPWQRELKAKWDELAAGKYDWAHLAMHLWPERVIPKCATDRSLAIAHGLEDVFWIEDSDGKWKARTTPLRTVEDLVRERSSPAVKAALKSLIEAPTGSGTSRPRGRRASSGAAAEGGSR